MAGERSFIEGRRWAMALLLSQFMMLAVLLECSNPVMAESQWLFKDICLGFHGSSDASGFTELNGSVYFLAAVDGFRQGLWKTNGTSGSLSLIAALPPTPPNSSNYGDLTRIGNRLYFGAWTAGKSTAVPWVSDGTAQGTFALNPGITFTSANPRFAEFNGEALFWGINKQTNRLEMWKTNGSAEGTQLVKQLDHYSHVPAFAKAHGKIYFSTFFSLWASDGTASGTVKVRDASSSMFTGLAEMAVIGDTLFFDDQELWKLEPGAPSPVKVKDIGTASKASFPKEFVVKSGTLFFIAFGKELWKSNGTESGTQLVKRFLSEPAYYYSHHLTQTGNRLIFFGSDGTGSTSTSIWASDGTSEGTSLIKNMQVALRNPRIAESGQVNVAALNGLLYFSGENSGSGTGFELFRTDGTPQGTSLAAEILSGAKSSYPWSIRVANGRLFFNASDIGNNLSIWTSNGSSSGTKKIGNPLFRPSSSFPDSFVEHEGSLFFAASSSSSSYGLWRSNGTVGGTEKIADGFFDDVVSFKGNLLLNYESKLNLFHPQTRSFTQLAGAPGYYKKTINSEITLFNMIGASSSSLWRTDGTVQGTRKLKDYFEGGLLIDSAVLNGKAYYAASSPGAGNELWVSDGTSTGTRLFADLKPGAEGSSPSGFVRHGNLVFFVFGPIRDQLWRTDGTASGTFSLTSPTNGPYSPYGIASSKNGVFFAAGGGGNIGTELWISGGTTATTRLVADLYAGETSSYPWKFAPVKNGVCFVTRSSNSPENYLWFSDGTAAGTVKLIQTPLAGSRIYASVDLFSVQEADRVIVAINSDYQSHLIVTDGTQGGTGIIETKPAPDLYWLPKGFRTFGSKLFYSDYSPETGIEPFAIPLGKLATNELLPGNAVQEWLNYR